MKNYKEIELKQSKNYERNIDLYGDYDDTCICCGKRTKNAKFQIHMSDNWMVCNLPTEEGFPDGIESQGAWTVGNDCAKKFTKEFIFKVK